ncbi:hypothetical protein BCR42DRAFT_440482 [Absidia repens]|uniref:Uncharacterized protein n=1 Tax=Absidia repens TaxID=90262 RepID=A0A1X2I844_9FUNG|nr:hypothetical protein BCR42DRAFT_440482 [Absidia repens]
MTRLDVLPTEIISLIIYDVSRRRDLYQCARINRSFHTATTPLLWETLRIHTTKYAIKRLRCLVQARPWVKQHIRTVDIQSCTGLTDNHMKVIITHVPCLERLFISPGYHFTDVSFQRLAQQHGSTLTSLSLIHCNHLTQRSFDALGKHAHHLRHLHLRHCQGVSGATFGALALCPLESLSMGYFDVETWEALAKGIPVHFAHFVRLTHVVLWHSHSVFVRPLLQATTNIWPALTHLRLDGGRLPLPDRGLLQAHSHITVLQLLDCQVTDATLAMIGAFLPKLNHLDISYNAMATAMAAAAADDADTEPVGAISPHAVRRLIMDCPLLTRLNLMSCFILRTMFPELTTLRRRLHHDSSYLFKLNHIAINHIRASGSGGDATTAATAAAAAAAVSHEGAACGDADVYYDDYDDTSWELQWWLVGRDRH